MMPKRYVYCPNNCGRKYLGSRCDTNLKRHLTMECGKIAKFQCEYCEKRFSYNYSLKRHLLVHRNIISSSNTNKLFM